MKKRRGALLAVLVFAVLLLAGCSKEKNESELLEDLLVRCEQSELLPEGCRITDLEVIKRLTDEKSRKDEVYVCVYLDHEAATGVRYFRMNYTKYNEGWMLDSLESYSDEMHPWVAAPKDSPSAETIEAEFLEYCAIERSKEDSTVYLEDGSSVGRNALFGFGDKEYALEIYDIEFNDTYYECLINVCTESMLFGGQSGGTLYRAKFGFSTYYTWDLVEMNILTYGRNYGNLWDGEYAVNKKILNEKEQKYAQLVQEYIDQLFVKKDYDAILSMTHPYCLDNWFTPYPVVLMKHDDVYMECRYCVPWFFLDENNEEFATELEDIMNELTSAGYNPENVGYGIYYIGYQVEYQADTDTIYGIADFVFIEEDGKTYVTMMDW